VLTGIKEKVIE